MTKKERIDRAILLLKECGFTVIPPNDVTVDESRVPKFDEFWSCYGKMVGRTKAEKLWVGLTAQEKCDCMEYVPKYVMNTPNKLYRKNPETFLRNKSWNDELIDTNNNGTDKRTEHNKGKLATTLGRIQDLLGS